MRRRLACCRRGKEISLDFDNDDSDHNGVMTYSGLESCIRNSYSCGTESLASGADDCIASESLDEEVSSSSLSSREACGSSSFSVKLMLGNGKMGDSSMDTWDMPGAHCLQLCSKGKVPAYTMRITDVETMKEKFAKLLLGDDASGGCKGVATALALSHAITDLAVSVFGELWKLEPLSEEKRNRWSREMDWLLSPTNYMIELVPAKQSGINGCMLEIMTPKARSDMHMSLPALRKLDSMLIDVLDSMVDTEFWYTEEGSRTEERGRGTSVKQTKKWWLPSPQVPEAGLSSVQRERLGFQGKIVHQVLKATKSINEHVLLQMPVPASVRDAIPKAVNASLGKDVYKAISSELISTEEILGMLNLKSEHSVLDIVNCLEGAVFAWKQKLSHVMTRKSPLRNSLTFMWDMASDLEKMEVSLERAESLLQLLKVRFPNLPQTFLDVTKVQCNKDVGHSIIEAYSRVLGSLAFSILSRIGDVLQEDDICKPNTPVATLKFDLSS